MEGEAPRESPQPQPGETELDPERQRKAKEYARISRRLFFIDLGIGLAALLLLWLAGLSADLRGALQLPRPTLIAAYTTVLMAGYGILLSPLAVYSGYVLPRRYGLSVQSFGGWLFDIIKGGAISFLLGLGAVEGIYLLLQRQPSLWWLWAAIAAFVVSVLLANLAPILIVPLFFKQRPLEDEDLKRRLLDLAHRAGARVRGVFVMDFSRKTTTANAALMGLGNTRRIVLADSLLQRYTPDEIEAVLAHELGHHVHRDIPKLMAMQAATTLLGLYLTALALDRATGHFGLRGVSDIANLPLLLLTIGVLSFLLRPLSNALSRRIEADADRYAVAETQRPQAFVSLMRKLVNQNLSEAEPARWVKLLFYSHPPLAERIAIAKSYEARRSST